MMAHKPEDGPCRGSRQAPVCPCEHLVTTTCKTALSSVPCHAVECGMSLTEFTKAATNKKSETSDVILLSYPSLLDIWNYLSLCDDSQALTSLASHSDVIKI